MKLLLDTHALIWWLLDDDRLSRRARAAISTAGSDAHVSAVSAYEIAQKYWLGRLPDAGVLAQRFDQEVTAEGFTPLLLASAEARCAGMLQSRHRDPFDRLLAGQAMVNGMAIISIDSAFDDLGAKRLW